MSSDDTDKKTRTRAQKMLSGTVKEDPQEDNQRTEERVDGFRNQSSSQQLKGHLREQFH